MKTAYFSFACLLGLTAAAADYVWTGALDADFSNPANWLVGGEIPASAPANDDSASGDVVILPETVSANHPSIPADWNLKELRFLGSNWVFSTGAAILKVGRFGNGVATANAGGTNVFSGNLRLGSVDTPGPGWDISSGGTLRVTGTVGRYAQTSGGGTIRKRGGGTLELETGTSTLNSLTVEGGVVRVISGVGTLDQNKSLTVSAGVYDLNGNAVAIAGLGGTANGTVTNGAASTVTLSTSFSGAATITPFISGALNLSWGHNGTPRTLTFTNGGNTYTGRTYINSGITAILRASSPLNAPGVFGASEESVTIGTYTSAGGGTVGRVAAILTDGNYAVGRHITVGTDKGRHILGATAAQNGVSTFSGNVLVGLGALYNGDNPHLEIEVGANAWVDFTGNITNALGATPNFALRDGRVYMFGPGVARFTGANTYKGGTIISNGTLLACSPTALGTAGAEVAGGTLGGTCTVAGPVSVLSGARLTAGETNTVGTMTFNGGLALAAGSALTFQIAGVAADRLNVAGGTFALTAPVSVALETLAAADATEYPLLDWSAATGSAQLSDFTLVSGGDTFKLVLRDNVLYARKLVLPGTVIRIF